MDIHNLHKKLHLKKNTSKQTMTSMASLGGLHRFSRWIHIGICSVQIVNICEEETPFRFQLHRSQRCQVVVVTEAHAVLAPCCADKCHGKGGE